LIKTVQANMTGLKKEREEEREKQESLMMFMEAN
jgi:hypothetical protein